MPILTNLKYNTIKQELKELRAHNKTMREVLEQIAASKRGGLNKRLASSCIGFIDNCLTRKTK